MSAKVYKGNMKVEKFNFSEIIANNIKEEEFSDFKLHSLNKVSSEDPQVKQLRIRKERISESQSSFSIDDIVREHRGIREQEEQDYENRVANEVKIRLDATEEDAYNKGHELGLKAGHDKAYNDTFAIIEEKINNFTNQIEQTINDLNSVYDKNKNDAYMMVKNLTKWVVLKEVDDKNYLERLLEKLILEIKTKNSLLIRVNQSSFEYMPELIEKVEKRVGQLTNARVEVELDMDGPGIILESENGIIDGTLKAQFESIDKLFENIGVVESNES